MGKPLTVENLRWALSFWGGWHAVGGIITIIVGFPVIGVLEKTHVRKIKGA